MIIVRNRCEYYIRACVDSLELFQSDDTVSSLLNRLLMIDPSLPTKKIKKRWDPFDCNDPNLEINLDRTENGLPPIDLWNIGVSIHTNVFSNVVFCLLKYPRIFGSRHISRPI